MGTVDRVTSVALVAVLVALAGPVHAQLPDVDLGPIQIGELDLGEFLGRLDVQIAVGVGLAGLAALGIGLGTRHVTADNALDNDSRAAMYETIQSDPGIHLRELARTEEMNITAAAWHLKKLEDVGLVRSQKTEGYKVFYASKGGRGTRNLGVARSTLKNDNAHRILRTVADAPGTHQRGLAERLDLNHATVRWHLDKLAAADLIVKVPTGYRTRYFLSAQGLHALQNITSAAS